MNTKLLTALKLSVAALENDTVKYKWNEQYSCNCGIVSQALLGLSAKELENKVESDFKKTGPRKTWKALVQTTCSITGQTTSNIIKNLMDNGLKPEDICHLEYLENKVIRKEAGIKVWWWDKKFYAKKKNLISYLKAWIRILEKTNTKTLTAAEQIQIDLLIESALKNEEKVNER